MTGDMATRKGIVAFCAVVVGVILFVGVHLSFSSQHPISSPETTYFSSRQHSTVDTAALASIFPVSSYASSAAAIAVPKVQDVVLNEFVAFPSDSSLPWAELFNVKSMSLLSIIFYQLARLWAAHLNASLYHVFLF